MTGEGDWFLCLMIGQECVGEQGRWVKELREVAGDIRVVIKTVLSDVEDRGGRGSRRRRKWKGKMSGRRW